jgi:septal ring factor EnvC (AmiA/AmiB activator)
MSLSDYRRLVAGRGFLLAGLAAALVVLAPAPRSSGAAAGQQAPDRLAALQREAESLARRERTLLGELRLLEIERDLRTEQLRRAEQEWTEAARQRAEAAGHVSAVEDQLASERPGVVARLVELYKLGRPGYMRLLLDVDGARSAGRAYRSVSALVETDRRRMADFRNHLADLRATEQKLAERTARAEELRLEAQNARRAAAGAVAAHTALIAKIDASRDLNARLAGELQAAQRQLSALPEAPPNEAPAVEPASVSALVQRRGALDWPAVGPVAARFGRQPGRDGSSTVRAGIDIAAAAGSPARAVEAGVVAYAQPFTGYGNLVIVDHGHQSYSLYGYLDSLAVGRGDQVARGQAVGAIGLTTAGKAGLYFELRVDGRAVDPLQWLKKRQGP